MTSHHDAAMSAGYSVPPTRYAPEFVLTDQLVHRYHRLSHQVIRHEPRVGESGFEGYAREMANAVCQAVGGRRWHAEAAMPREPTDKVDQHTQIAITVDDARRVEVHRTEPAGGRPEWWIITVDGQPIPHRPRSSELPLEVSAIARSVWRHLNGVSVEVCEPTGCARPATVATYTGSTCFLHAPGNSRPARPAPSAAPVPPLPHPARGAGGPPVPVRPRAGR